MTRGFGYVYVTSEMLATNPWDNLPTFWTAEVNYIEQVNQSCVPTVVQLSTIASERRVDYSHLAFLLLMLVITGQTIPAAQNPAVTALRNRAFLVVECLATQ